MRPTPNVWVLPRRRGNAWKSMARMATAVVSVMAALYAARYGRLACGADSSPNGEATPSGKDQSSRLVDARRPTCRIKERIPATAGMPTSGDIMAAMAGTTMRMKSATTPVDALTTLPDATFTVSPLAFILMPRHASSARLAAAPSGTINTIADTSVNVVPSLFDTNASLRSRLDGAFAAPLAPHAGSGHRISSIAAMSAMRSAYPRVVIGDDAPRRWCPHCGWIVICVAGCGLQPSKFSGCGCPHCAPDHDRPKSCNFKSRRTGN